MMFYDGRWDEGLDCSIDDVLSARLPSRDDPAPLGIAPDRSPKQSSFRSSRTITRLASRHCSRPEPQAVSPDPAARCNGVSDWQCPLIFDLELVSSMKELTIKKVSSSEESSSCGFLGVALRYDCCICRFAAISRFLIVFGRARRCVLDICDAFLDAASGCSRSYSVEIG
jgi:hypothetical protein